MPVKLCRTAVSIHLSELTGKLIPKHVKLRKKHILGYIKLAWMGLT